VWRGININPKKRTGGRREGEEEAE